MICVQLVQYVNAATTSPRSRCNSSRAKIQVSNVIAASIVNNAGSNRRARRR